MKLIEDFVRLKLSAAFDLSEHTELESNQVIKWLQTHYLERLAVDLESKYYELTKQSRTMAETKEDLFAKFYNEEKMLIASMTSEDFRVHEETLAQIAFEAKARLTAIVDKKREDNASRSHSQREWIVNKTDAEDQLVSDAINTVNTRKKRMNKIDKLSEMLKGFVDEETLKAVIGTVEKKATEKQVNLISFVKTKSEEKKQEESESKADSEPKVVFDPAKLKFGA